MVNLHAQITARIVASLEKGVQPWFKPWAGEDSGFLRPLRSNGEPYHGVNVLMLWITQMEKAYTSQYWMTYKQATEFGGQVRKGEKSTIVVYASKFVKTDDQGDDKIFSFLKSYNVFNADQIDGLPEKFYAKTVQTLHVNSLVVETRNETADTFFDHLGMKVHHGGAKAYFNQQSDTVHLPKFEAFQTGGDYYCTKLHEAVHWTKVEKRLDRDLGKKRWGDEGYALEELVAELGAAFGAADLNIRANPRADHASYIANWLKVLKNDTKAIFSMASYAEKAVAYLHEQVAKN